MGASTICCSWLSLILKGLSGIIVELFFTFITSNEPVVGILYLEGGYRVLLTVGLFKFILAPTNWEPKLKLSEVND